MPSASVSGRHRRGVVVRERVLAVEPRVEGGPRGGEIDAQRLRARARGQLRAADDPFWSRRAGWGGRRLRRDDLEGASLRGGRRRARHRRVDAPSALLGGDDAAVVDGRTQLGERRDQRRRSVGQRIAGEIAQDHYPLVDLRQLLDRRARDLDGRGQVRGAVARGERVERSPRGGQVRRRSQRETRRTSGEHDRDRVAVARGAQQLMGAVQGALPARLAVDGGAHAERVVHDQRQRQRRASLARQAEPGATDEGRRAEQRERDDDRAANREQGAILEPAPLSRDRWRGGDERRRRKLALLGATASEQVRGDGDGDEHRDRQCGGDHERHGPPPAGTARMFWTTPTASSAVVQRTSRPPWGIKRSSHLEAIRSSASR